MSENSRFTPDLRSMINILIYNSLGFFFLDFLVYYYTSQELTVTGLQLGLIFTLNIFGNMLSSTFTGYITDKVKSKSKMVLIGSFGRGIAYFVIYIAFFYASLLGIYIGYFCLGFFVGFFWIPFNTLISQKSRKDNRSEAFGKREAAVGRGLVIGAVIGFTIFNFTVNYTDNPLIIYLAIPLSGLANFYAGIKFIRTVDESIIISESTNSNNKQITSNKKIKKNLLLGIFLISVVLLLANMNGSLARPFLNKYLLEVITSEPFLASMVYLPAGAVSMFLAPKLGELVDRIKPELGISITSIIGAVTTWFIINTDNYFIFSILLTIDVTIVQTANLVVQNLISRISVEHRGKSFGALQIFMGSGNVVGPILGGLAWDYISITAPFIISIIVELCLIPFYVLSVIVIKPQLKEGFKAEIKEDF
ncbi:MAG: MFS transporter [Promethearchaeota archaeon]|nr:MAG: MFS transporter [Candidatus Lokiarchaeota archaeon]